MSSTSNFHKIQLSLTVLALILLVWGVPGLLAQEQVAAAVTLASSGISPSAPANISPLATTLLGPGDEITVAAVDIEEIAGKKFRILPNGTVELPLAGRMQAGGKTVEQFEADLIGKLKAYVKYPDVTVTLSETRSRPVSVLGSVNTPGVQQLEGRKTLIEVISGAGGVKPDASAVVTITRKVEYGMLPLRDAHLDPSGQFSIGTLNLAAVMKGHSPENNLVVMPDDVVSVPRADIVYVLGDVKKSGGFVVDEGGSLSVLRAISMANGTERTAKLSQAHILRAETQGQPRKEEIIDISKLLKDESTDVMLHADDILWVPSSTSKRVLSALGTAALQAAVFGHY